LKLLGEIGLFSFRRCFSFCLLNRIGLCGTAAAEKGIADAASRTATIQNIRIEFTTPSRQLRRSNEEANVTDKKAQSRAA
jgi:hypothetical protein